MIVFSVVHCGERVILVLSFQVLTIVHVVHAIQRIVWIVDDQWSPQAVAVLSRVVRMVPVGTRLTKCAKPMHEATTRSDWTLGDERRSICPV